MWRCDLSRVNEAIYFTFPLGFFHRQKWRFRRDVSCQEGHKAGILFGQIIATLTRPHGGLAMEIPLFQGHLGWMVKYIFNLARCCTPQKIGGKCPHIAEVITPHGRWTSISFLGWPIIFPLPLEIRVLRRPNARKWRLPVVHNHAVEISPYIRAFDPWLRHLVRLI